MPQSNARGSEAQAKAAAIAKAKAIAPDLTARIGSTPKTKFRGDPDVFGRLVEDHDRHRALLAMIEETQGASADRRKLFDIGVAGPLAGLVIAIPLLFLGLSTSPVATLPQGVPAQLEGNSILYYFAKLAVFVVGYFGINPGIWHIRDNFSLKIFLHVLPERDIFGVAQATIWLVITFGVANYVSFVVLLGHGL